MTLRDANGKTDSGMGTGSRRTDINDWTWDDETNRYSSTKTHKRLPIGSWVLFPHNG